MRADGDAVRSRAADRGAKDRRVARVKPGGDARGRNRLHQAGVVADGVRAERFSDVCVEVDTGQRGAVYKQKGTALLRCPPAPPVWLPQQFTAPCRNQTGDSPIRKAMAMPVKILGKTAISCSNGVNLITNPLPKLQKCQE